MELQKRTRQLHKTDRNRKLINRRNLATILVLFSICFSASAYNWPSWRGPIETGSVPSGNPPVSWSETENILWKATIPGNSTSTPIIWGDKLFFQTSIELPSSDSTGSQASEGGGGRRSLSRPPSGEYSFDLVCLDRNTGEIIWQKTACRALPHEGHHPDHGFASFSPVTDGQYVWTNFGSRGVYCWDFDGNIIWSKEMPQMETRAGFGEGSSPALAGDALIVVADQEGDSLIYAFNKLTGELLWKKERDERTSWATPLVLKVNDRLEVITNATNFIRSYDAKTGDIVWQCSGQTENVIPTPVSGEGLIFCTSGYRGSALQAIRIGQTGDLSGSDAIVWQVDKDTPYVPSPLLHDGRIYVISGNRGVASCYKASDGTPLFVKQDLDGIRGIYASPVGVEDKIYFPGREGVTVVLKAADNFEIISTNTLDDGFDASPVIIGDKLYLKGRKSLYCIGE
jgi:outer membrane protein assembly factor BamB